MARENPFAPNALFFMARIGLFAPITTYGEGIEGKGKTCRGDCLQTLISKC